MISTTIILTYKTEHDSVDVTRKIPGNNKTDIEDNMFEMMNEIPASARLVSFYFAEEDAKNNPSRK